MNPLHNPLPHRTGPEWGPRIRPIIPAPHRHKDDLTALTRVSMLIGFCLGVIVASVAWCWLTW